MRVYLTPFPRRSRVIKAIGLNKFNVMNIWELYFKKQNVSSHPVMLAGQNWDEFTFRVKFIATLSNSGIVCVQ